MGKRKGKEVASKNFKPLFCRDALHPQSLQGSGAGHDFYTTAHEGIQSPYVVGMFVGNKNVLQAAEGEARSLSPRL